MSTLGKNIANALNGAFGDGSKSNAGVPAQANAIIAQQITSHLLANTKISVTYTGVIPGTPPSPESGADSAVLVVGACGTIPNASGDWPGAFTSWVSGIETAIKNGFMVSAGALIKPISPILAFNVPTPLITFLTPSKINGAMDNSKDCQSKVWDAIGESIIKWLTSQVPVPPTYAASLVGTGVATITSISITD